MHIIIMLFESNSKSQSDYKYARSLLNEYFNIEKFKFEKIFTGCKSRLYSNQTSRKIDSIFKQNKRNNPKYTILFFADIDTNTGSDKTENNKIINFSKDYSNSHVVWLNRNIEHVFLGKTIEKNKPDEANKYLQSRKIKELDVNILKKTDPFSSAPSSNMYLVFSDIFPKKDK